MKKYNKIKILIVTLITTIIMGISSITVYSNVCAPKFYDYFIEIGIKYLIDGKYEEAILAFSKAIEIEENSIEARLYLAQGYVGNNEPDKAKEVLKEAQEIDITNEELLKDIINILYEIDEDVEYEFLDRFINEVGKDNIPDDINKILDSANELPSKPNENDDLVEPLKPMGQINTGNKISDGLNKPVTLPEENNDLVELIKPMGQINIGNKTPDKSNKPVALPEENDDLVEPLKPTGQNNTGNTITVTLPNKNENDDLVEPLKPMGQNNTGNKIPNESNKPVTLPEENNDLVKPLKPMGQNNTGNKIPNELNKPVALPE